MTSVNSVKSTHSAKSPVYVLVHGAWHGAWCWERVLPLFGDAGHRAHAVNLTGVGERAHLLSAQITVATHAADVMEVVRSHEWSEVILVGHSYGGVVVTQVAQRLLDEMPGVLQHVIYIDAHVPKNGESWGTMQTAETRLARIKEAQTVGGGVFLNPPDASKFGLTGADRDWVNRRQTPQPFGVYLDPMRIDDAAQASLKRSYINCVGNVLSGLELSRERVKADPSWTYLEIDSGHDPMVSHPETLVALLLQCARAA